MTKKQKDYKPVPVYNRKLVRNILKEVNVKQNGQHKVNKMMHIDFSKFHKHEETVDSNKNPIKAFYTQKGRRHAKKEVAV